MRRDLPGEVIAKSNVPPLRRQTHDGADAKVDITALPGGFELGQGAAHGLNFRFALVNWHSPSGGREATSPAIATNGSIAGDIRAKLGWFPMRQQAAAAGARLAM